jgi:hypothetical protein
MNISGHKINAYKDEQREMTGRKMKREYILLALMMDPI